MRPDDANPPGPGLDPADAALRQGLRRCHIQDAVLSRQTHDLSVDVIALTRLLVSKGLIAPEELEGLKPAAHEQVIADRARTFTGPVLYPTPEGTGNAPIPAVLVDCAQRYTACRAACCTLYDVYLTEAEVRGGRYRWDLERPYRLERRADGSCTYLDAATRQCSIWETRPTVCRGYSCASDPNIWVDFERRVGTGAGRKPTPA